MAVLARGAGSDLDIGNHVGRRAVSSFTTVFGGRVVMVFRYAGARHRIGSGRQSIHGRSIYLSAINWYFLNGGLGLFASDPSGAAPEGGGDGLRDLIDYPGRCGNPSATSVLARWRDTLRALRSGDFQKPYRSQ